MDIRYYYRCGGYERDGRAVGKDSLTDIELENAVVDIVGICDACRYHERQQKNDEQTAWEEHYAEMTSY